MTIIVHGTRLIEHSDLTVQVPNYMYFNLETLDSLFFETLHSKSRFLLGTIITVNDTCYTLNKNLLFDLV